MINSLKGNALPGQAVTLANKKVCLVKGSQIFHPYPSSYCVYENSCVLGEGFIGVIREQCRGAERQTTVNTALYSLNKHCSTAQNLKRRGDRVVLGGVGV